MLAVGPVPMMKAVADVTKGPGIHTVVSLNPIMIDGTGMCGGCRVIIGGKSKFACVDGPEFEAHEVDFSRADAAEPDVPGGGTEVAQRVPNSDERHWAAQGGWC